MLVAFPYCSFKCDIENGNQVCQNWELAKARRITVEAEDVVARYVSNDLTKAVVFAGLEPFDSWQEMIGLIKAFREVTHDDIVIYTGYNSKEIDPKITYLNLMFDNIVVKFGRYVPNMKSRFDDVLGVNLASDNQYAVRIS